MDLHSCGKLSNSTVLKLTKLFVESQHAFIFNRILQPVFLDFPRLSCQSFINFHVYPHCCVTVFLRSSLFLMRENSSLLLSAVNHCWLGQEQQPQGLSSACTHTFTHTWLEAKLGMSDYSCYLRHISRQWLSKSVHSAWHSIPKPFRHTSLDRWIGVSKAGRATERKSQF